MYEFFNEIKNCYIIHVRFNLSALNFKITSVKCNFEVIIRSVFEKKKRNHYIIVLKLLKIEFIMIKYFRQHSDAFNN